MFKTIKTTAMGVAALVLSAVGFAPEAKAYGNDYCREYTRTVYIGGRSQDAYGTACLQPNGDWMIVGEGLGNDIPDNVSNVNYVIRDNNRYVTPTRVVYYERNYYRSPRVQPTFIWYNNGRHYRNGHYVNYKNWNRHDNRWDRHQRWERNDRHDRHDRDDHRGRGRGHGRD